MDAEGLRLFLFGETPAVQHSKYLIEEATGLRLAIGADREITILGEGSGGSSAARKYFREIVESDECVKPRASTQERGRFRPNYGLFRTPEYGIDLHEIYLRPFRLLKEQAGAPYAYGALIHKLVEAAHEARTGSGYELAHAHANIAQAEELSDFGITTLSINNNLFLEGSSVYNINRHGGYNRGINHVHVQSVSRTQLFP